MPEYKLLFKDFKGRDDDLRKVTRYSLYTPMFYRTNIYTHSIRAAAIVREVNKVAVKVFGSDYNPVKAEYMALVHDDAEIYFGDIQAGNKSKMTAEQLEKVRRAELDAIEIISKRFPKKLAEYDYRQLLIESENYSTLESQIMNYADKFDALGEALHEIFAGNKAFVTNVNNSYGLIPVPSEYYTVFFKEFKEKFPAAKPLFKLDHPLLKILDKTDYKKEAQNGRPHTKESLNNSSGDPRYDLWKQIVLKIDNYEVFKDLYIRKES